MKGLRELRRLGRTIRSIGFDDAPFDHAPGSPVHFAGVVCADTRFEGMVWGSTTKDGLDATDAIASVVLHSKFLDQLHVVLLDGIAMGGFNVVDLAGLAEQLDRPCIAVMRRQPDLTAIHRVLRALPDSDERLQRLERAGPIHGGEVVCFQVAGEDPDVVPEVLAQLTDRGNVPECLRIAHLVGSAVVTGQSGRRA